MEFDLNNTDFLIFIVYPVCAFLVWIIYNVFSYIWNRNDNIIWNQEAKKDPIVNVYFILFTSLLFTSIIHSYIIYSHEGGIENIALNYKYYFLWAIITSLVLKNIVFNMFIKYVLKNKESEKRAKALTYSILWIALSEIPEVIWLTFMFDLLTK